jgi:hypothetical protein
VGIIALEISSGQYAHWHQHAPTEHQQQSVLSLLVKSIVIATLMLGVTYVT